MIQESTMQVPCGKYSPFCPEHGLKGFALAVYIIMNERSNWTTGKTHALSYSKIADILKADRSQVIRAVKSLIADGWIKLESQRKSDKANIYRLTHHMCEPEQVPVDKDGRPQKCAVPRGDNSPTAIMAHGNIGWREMVQWVVMKIRSDWVTGVVEMTMREAKKAMKFSWKTLKTGLEKMSEVGLIKKISANFRRSEFELYPAPYPERVERAEETADKKALPLIKGWFYSYNFKWRFRAKDFRLQRKDVGRWRDTSDTELARVNPKISADFEEAQHYIVFVRKSVLG